MKQVSFFILLVVAFSLLPGCKKWLDVGSKAEVVENDMFSNEEGFTDAMAGVYYTMAGSSLYGDPLTMSFIEVIAHRYDLFAYGIGSSTYAYANPYFGTAAYYNQGDAITQIVTNVWDTMYYAIANVNNVLANIDKHKSVFAGNDYNLIKGEALGLRAFMHFDLLRLFGHAYADAPDSANIPYVTVFSAAEITPLATTNAVLDSAIVDLNAAATLLAGDNIQGASDVNDWLNNRTFHFNALAVEATLARIYLYKGDKQHALIHALNVINSGALRFITSAELTGMGPTGMQTVIDWTFSPEQIFSLSDFKLQPFFNTYFSNPGNSNNLSNDCGKGTGSIENLDNIYEVSTGGGSDYRYLYLWLPDFGYYFCQKYNQFNAVVVNDLPLIRLPEMYYIAAECGGPADGLPYLNKVRENRGLTDLPTGLSPDNFQDEIFKEYQKEFYCEGQLFYYYKRLNMPYMLDYDNITQVPTAGGVYILPLPEAERQYGGR